MRLQKNTGQTSNLKDRLYRHNHGLVKSTKAGAPWQLIHSEAFSSRSSAVLKEREIKNRNAKRYLESLGKFAKLGM